MTTYNRTHQLNIDSQSEPESEPEFETAERVADEWVDPLLLLRQTRRYHRLPYYARAKARALHGEVGISQLRMIESAIRCDIACRDAVSAWRAAA